MKYIKIGFILLFLQVMHISMVEAAYYRWTDEDGKTHYSSSIPPSQVKLGHVELNKQGIKKDETSSLAKKRQIDEIARIKKEKQAKLEEAKKIEVEKREKQAEEDRLLLSIFSSEKEITASYDTKLEMAQSTIKLLERSHESQSQKLLALEERYQKITNSKHKEKLEKQIDVAIKNLEVYQKAIDQNLSEKDKVNSDYKETLKRFRRLSESYEIGDT